MVKNVPGNRINLVWKHEICNDSDSRKIQSKFCQKTIIEEVYHLKHHLAGTQKDAVACKSVSNEVK